MIDGGFAKRKLGSAQRPATAGDFQRLVSSLSVQPALSGMRLHRVYYYDSMPLESTHTKPLGGSIVDFGTNPLTQRSKTLFKNLANQPFTALRLGDLAFEGWRVSEKALNSHKAESIQIRESDLIPQISQKGVDMRLGMDIASLTLKKQVQTIVLVSGDSDFVPAMKFARREGVTVFLCSLGQKVKPAMIEHSDMALILEIDRDQLSQKVSSAADL